MAGDLLSVQTGLQRMLSCREVHRTCPILAASRTVVSGLPVAEIGIDELRCPWRTGPGGDFDGRTL